MWRTFDPDVTFSPCRQEEAYLWSAPPTPARHSSQTGPPTAWGPSTCHRPSLKQTAGIPAVCQRGWQVRRAPRPLYHAGLSYPCHILILLLCLGCKITVLPDAPCGTTATGKERGTQLHVLEDGSRSTPPCTGSQLQPRNGASLQRM